MDAGAEAEVRVGGAADVQVVWLGEDVGIPSGRAEQDGDFASGGQGNLLVLAQPGSVGVGDRDQVADQIVAALGVLAPLGE